MPRGSQALVLASFVGFVVLGGANGTAVAYSNRELAPFWGAALRFVAATLAFAVIALVRRRPFPRGRELHGALWFGLLAYFGTYALIYWAFETVKPGAAQVILALVPLVTLGLASLQRVEPFRWTALAGGVVCLAGIAYIFRGSVAAGVSASGILALLGATLCIAQAGLVAQRFPKADWAITNVVALAPAAALFLALSLAVREPWIVPHRPATWVAVTYLVVFGSVAAFALYLHVLRNWPASRAAYQWVLLPIVAVPLSALLTGEPMTLGLVTGAAVVLVGVYVGAFWRPRTRRTAA